MRFSFGDVKEQSVEGLKRIGRGGNGTVYQLDDERIIKIYNDSTDFKTVYDDKIRAVQLFKSGTNCPISMQLVKSNGCYGIIFERIGGETVAEALMADPGKCQELGSEMGKLFRKLHNTSVKEVDFPDIGTMVKEWIGYLEEHVLDQKDVSLVRELESAIPHRDTLLHLDYHEKNVMIDSELVLIDTDDVCTGNPLYDQLVFYFNHSVITRLSPETVHLSIGVDSSMALCMESEVNRAYLMSADEEILKRYNEKMQLLAPYYMLLFIARGRNTYRIRKMDFGKVLLEAALPPLRKNISEMCKLAQKDPFDL